jgi:hypothetical protein
MSAEGRAAVLLLAVVLDDGEAVEFDPRRDERLRRAGLVPPARGGDDLLADPLAGEDGEALVVWSGGDGHRSFFRDVRGKSLPRKGCYPLV